MVKGEQMQIFQSYLIKCLIIASIISTANAQWKQTSGPPHVEITSALASFTGDTSGTNIYAGTYSGGVFFSTNNGDSWESIVGKNWDNNTGSFTKKNITALLPLKDNEGNVNLFAGTEGDGIFLSVNNDTNWTAVNKGLTNPYIFNIIAVDTFLFATAGTSLGTGNIFRSSNNGTSWVTVNNGLADTSITSLAFYKDKRGITNLFAGGRSVYHSTNYGENWVKYDNELTNQSVTDLAVIDTTLFAVANYKVFRSDNNSKSWKEIGSGLPFGAILIAVNDTIIYAESGNDIYYSLNRGFEWLYGGEPDYAINCMEIGGKYLFVGVFAPFFVANSVWKRSLSEMTTTDIRGNNKPFPTGFGLCQNYPNPFNPNTNINYTIPNSNFVSITVYDVLGNKIETLVNEYKSAGSYQTRFNGENFSSGIYFYRLQAGNYIETKKMILLQ